MKDLPVRKKIRLKDYNYSQNGAYFVTICVKDRHELLGRIIVGDAHPGVPSVELNKTGEMVQQHIENINIVYPSININKFVVMTNHIHLIIIANAGMPECYNHGTPGCASPTKSMLAKVINALKSLTTRQFGKTLWQRTYHDHIIRNEAEYQKIWQYIDENPAKWAEDCYYTA